MRYDIIYEQPHVTVALRMNSTFNTTYKHGDTVAYVICRDDSGNGAMQRAYHERELTAKASLRTD